MKLRNLQAQLNMNLRNSEEILRLKIGKNLRNLSLSLLGWFLIKITKCTILKTPCMEICVGQACPWLCFMFPSLLPHATSSTISAAPKLVDFIVPIQITKGSRKTHPIFRQSGIMAWPKTNSIFSISVLVLPKPKPHYEFWL